MESPLSTGFKEWQVVCDALASGRQKILLRKGGIHEGRTGFSFAHNAFFLFPTRFHANASQVREGHVETAPEWREGDPVSITHFVRVPRAVTLFEWDAVAALEPLHIYAEATVRDRFFWQGRNMPSGSIHVALAETRRLASPWRIRYVPAFGGCRSWITLPKPPAGLLDGAQPVCDPGELAALAARLF